MLSCGAFFLKRQQGQRPTLKSPHVCPGPATRPRPIVYYVVALNGVCATFVAWLLTGDLHRLDTMIKGPRPVRIQVQYAHFGRDALMNVEERSSRESSRNGRRGRCGCR